MNKKEFIRKKYFLIRKKKYFQINEKFFNPLALLFKKLGRKKGELISIYFPNSFEIDVLAIFNNEYFKRFKFLLPKISNNNTMNFYKWKNNEILKINKYGIPEPLQSIALKPDIVLVPLLAFDKKKNRLGYGGGYYDKYLNKYLKDNKKILTVGVAFSFQKYNNLPVNNKDFKLDFVITEKGTIK